MAMNPYMNFYSANNEQSLYENMFIESIQMFGFATYYLPQTQKDFDEVFRESPSKVYKQAIEIETYLKSNMKFGGDGKFISMTSGFEIRDQTIFTVSQKKFKELTGFDRPREGDLVFLPLDKKCYEIKFVEHQDIFYQLGRLISWDIQCELMEYNGQQFATGIADIDLISTKFDMDDTEENTIEDWVDQSSEIQTIANNYIDWTEKDPFGGGGVL
jgi:hypothetical protein